MSDRMLSDEILLGLIKANSGGGGGTTDYEDLNNLPEINSIELKGNKSLSDLGIASVQSVSNITNGQSINNFADVETVLSSKQDTLTFDDTPTDNSNNPVKSNGIYDALALKQNATDNNLDTDAKTIVGAINEHEGDVASLKSGLTNLDNEVNGDATVYPYADVITIPDAVPANVADCSVKIEPVQDLHGQSAPYVGGAGKNKLPLIANREVGGITVTRNGDGTVTFNGTADSDRDLWFADSLGLSAGTSRYITTGLNTAINGFSMVISPSYAQVTTNFTSDVAINGAYFHIVAGTVFDHVVVSPMICLASETDKSFAPYSNICPISGHTEAKVTRDGKNQLDISAVTSGYRLNISTGLPEVILGFCVTDYIKCNELTTYTANWQYFSSGDYGMAFYDANKMYISGARQASEAGHSSDPWTFTTTNGAKYFRMTYVEENVDVNTLQVELGSSATDYEPYQGKTYTIALGDTIYGGTVDFDSGVMTVTHAVVDMGTLSWTKVADGLYRAEQSGMKNTADNEIADMLCETYFPDMYNRLPAGSIALRYTNQIWVRDNTVADATELTTNLDGKKLCYPLGTPTTIQLTPQQIQLLKGTNTLTASTGQISVTVNGVSGAIGQVQEQVNELAEEVAEIKPVDYSTTEQKTGQKWIDGKDIYIKTISLAETDFTKTNNWFWRKDIEPLITGYETIVKIYGAAMIEFDGSKHLLPFGSEIYYNDNADKCIKFANYYRNIVIKGTPYNDSDVNFATKNLAIVKCNITIAYTKSTT